MSKELYGAQYDRGHNIFFLNVIHFSLALQYSYPIIRYPLDQSVHKFLTVSVTVRTLYVTSL